MNIRANIHIQAPQDLVFNWIKSPEKAQQWMSSVTHYTILEEAENMVGTRFTETIGRGKNATLLQGQITQFRENVLLGFELESKYSLTAVSYQLTENAGKTDLQISGQLSFKSMLRYLGPAMGIILKRSVHKQLAEELQQLKKLAESDTI